MAAFATVRKGKLGYSKTEVDLLIARAPGQYASPTAHVLDWRELSNHVFSMEKNGYQPAAVDAAIEKLQDTFAQKELAERIVAIDPIAQALAARVSRPKGKRFKRANVLGLGYSRSQVDAVLTLVGDYLEGTEELQIGEVRELKFKLKRGGYIESQVDAYIDRLVEHIQTKRFAKPVVPAVVRPTNVVDGSEFYSQPGHEAY